MKKFLGRNPWIFIVVFIVMLITGAVLPARYLEVKLLISCGELLLLLLAFKSWNWRNE